MSKKKYVVNLDPNTIEYLESYVNKGHHLARSIKRARALLLASSGESDEFISRKVGYKSSLAIYHIRRRYFEEGLERAIHDKKRSGRPRKLDSRDRAHLSALACSQAPDGRNRWTLRLLSKKLVDLEIVDSICPATVGSELKKTS